MCYFTRCAQKCFKDFFFLIRSVSLKWISCLCAMWRGMFVCDLEQENCTWSAPHKSTSQLFLTQCFIFCMHQLLTLWWCSPLYSYDVSHKMSLLHSSLTRCPTSPRPMLLCTRDLSEEKALANLVSKDWVSELSSWLQEPVKGGFWTEDYFCICCFISSK